jgi:IS1 family transposase
MMVEGNSIRAIVRMTGASKNTIVKLLEDAGEAFSVYQDRMLRDLPCKRLQLDEIWAFTYCKQRTVPLAKKAPEDAGDLWTWVALCADTKLVPSWRVGDRSGETAIEFVCDLSKRLASRPQVTSDGHRAYLEAVEAGFGGDVYYAQLIKLYGEVPHPEGRYCPAQIQGTKTFCCTGSPDPRYISTSYVERQNLTMRMSMKRFARLSNGFSKKQRTTRIRSQFISCITTSCASRYPRDGGSRDKQTAGFNRHGACDRGLGGATRCQAR